MHRLEKKTKKKVYMDRRDESLPLKPNIKKKKSKERQGSRTNAVEARTADGLFSVCFDAYSGRAAKMGGTGAMESERKIEDIT